jgi:hypothetical protein
LYTRKKRKKNYHFFCPPLAPFFSSATVLPPICPLMPLHLHIVVHTGGSSRGLCLEDKAGGMLTAKLALVLVAIMGTLLRLDYLLLLLLLLLLVADCCC